MPAVITGKHYLVTVLHDSHDSPGGGSVHSVKRQRSKGRFRRVTSAERTRPELEGSIDGRAGHGGAAGPVGMQISGSLLSQLIGYFHSSHTSGREERHLPTKETFNIPNIRC